MLAPSGRAALAAADSAQCVPRDCVGCLPRIPLARWCWSAGGLRPAAGAESSWGILAAAPNILGVHGDEGVSRRHAGPSGVDNTMLPAR